MRKLPLVLLFACFVSSAAAQSVTIQRLTGPDHLNAKALERDGDGRLYLLTNVGDVYGSTDRGLSWSLLRLAGIDEVTSIGIDSTDAILVSESGVGVWRSTDHGASWQPRAAGLDGSYILDLLTLPSGVVLAATGPGIRRWSEIDQAWISTDPSMDGVSVYRMAAINDTMIVATANNRRFYRSTDAGVSWDSISVLPSAASLAPFVVDRNGTILVISGGYVQRSSDRGTTWSSTGVFASIAVLFSDEQGNSYVGTTGGITKIWAGGSVSEPVSSTGLAVPWVTCGTGVAGGLVVGTVGGVYHLPSGSGMWERRQTGIRAADVRDLEITPGGAAFAAMYGGIARSTDEGATWQWKNQGCSSVLFSSVFWSRSNVLLAGSSSGLFRSTDGGELWTASNSGMTAAPAAHFVEDAEGRIFAGAQGQGIVRSLNQGLTWQTVNNGISGLAVQGLSMHESGTLYAFYPSNVVYRSTDHGDSWTVFCMTSERVVAMHVTRGGAVLMGMASGSVFRTETGSPITTVAVGLGTNSYIRFAEDSSGRLVAAGENGLFRSLDQGLNWDRADASLMPLRATFVANSGGAHLMATGGRGIYRVKGLFGPSINLGTVALGDTSGSAVLLPNPTPAPVEFTLELSHGLPFAIDGTTSVTVPAGDTATAIVLFVPVELGSFVDTLVVRTPTDTVSYKLLGDSPAPTLVASPASVHVAGVTKDSTRSALIRLTNTSANVLRIDSASTHTPEFTVEPLSCQLSLAESVSVRVWFAPTTFGIFHDTLRIWSNSGSGTLLIPLSGSSDVGSLMASPPSLALGPVALDDTASADVALVNLSAANAVLVDRVSLQTPAFFVDAPPPIVVAPTSAVVLTIRFNPDRAAPKGYGIHRDTLTVGWAGAEVRVAIEGTSPHPEIAVVPPWGSTGGYQFGDTTRWEYTVMNPGVNTLVIDSVRLQTDRFAAAIEDTVIAPGETTLLRVEYPIRQYGVRMDTMRIWSNALTAPAPIPLIVRSDWPLLHTSHASVSFANVQAGTTGYRTIEIADSSYNRLVIDSVYTLTSSFVVAPLRGKIIEPVLDTAAIVIQFKPDSLRAYHDTLYIANNSAVNPYKIPLHGVGSLTGVDGGAWQVPKAYGLSQNYPNPFNPSTSISMDVPVRSRIRVTVINLLGQVVEELAHAEFEAGLVVLRWQPRGPSGIYICRMEAVASEQPGRRYVASRKMVFMR